jgi:ATP-dependent Clp protease ATP-binding subunit ClpA
MFIVAFKAKLLKKNTVTSSEIDSVISRMAKLPLQELSKSEKDKVQDLYKNLEKEIFGQPEAIKIIHEAITISKTGLREDNKTQAAFLFTGPTGVGKTEACKVLSKTLGMPLLRFDMSEYTEPHSISKLIGSPPGYVGYEQGGELTEKINEFPYAVLLLDEIEKAHPQIYNLFLQMLDRGMLTDAQGREIDCRQLIVIMTSNIGAAAVQKGSIELSSSTAHHKRVSALNSTFSPEFRNRLDGIIEFNPLSTDAAMKVVSKEINELKEKNKKFRSVLNLIMDLKIISFLLILILVLVLV